MSALKVLDEIRAAFLVARSTGVHSRSDTDNALMLARVLRREAEQPCDTGRCECWCLAGKGCSQGPDGVDRCSGCRVRRELTKGGRAMRDRVKGLTVILKRDYREDDVEMLIDAITLLTGVAKVTKIIAQQDDYVVRQRAYTEIEVALMDALLKARKGEGR